MEGRSQRILAASLGTKFDHNVISGADFALCREKWPVHGGQLQLHRNKGDL